MKFKQHEVKLLISLSKIKQIYHAYTDIIIAVGFKPASKKRVLAKLSGYTYQNLRTALKRLQTKNYVVENSDKEYFLTEKGIERYNRLINETSTAFNAFTEQVISNLNQQSLSKTDKIITVKKLTQSGLSQRAIAKKLNMPLSTTNKYSRLNSISA